MERICWLKHFLLLSLIPLHEAFLPEFCEINFRSTDVRSSSRLKRVTSVFDGTNVDPWSKALENASGKNTGGFIGLGELKDRKKLKGIAAPVREKDKRLEENNALLKWLSENGVWVYDRSDWGQASHGLAVAVDTSDEIENERTGRGMVANKEINEGDELFSIPMKLLLSKDAARSEFGPEIVTDDMSDYMAIALLLIHEKSKGQGSFWKPYIDILPSIEEVAPTWYWTEEDLSFLEGSPVIRSTNSMILKLKAEYETYYTKKIDKYPSIFDHSVHTFSEFQWAFSILFSRAIRLANLSAGELVALIPYADLFNHNPFVNSYVDTRKVGWFETSEEVVVYSDRSYKPMDQVYISYGPKSNGDLLLLYGFALDRNPFNSVDLTVVLSEADPMFEDKREFLLNANQPMEMSFPLYPDEARQYMRLICLEKSDYSEATKLEEVDFSEKVSKRNELNVLSLIETACKEALQRYPSTEEADTAIMMDQALFNTLTKNQRMAVKHRRQEKRILKRTIAAITAQKSQIV